MADPKLVGLVCKREQVAEARAAAAHPRHLVSETPLKVPQEGGDYYVVVLYYHVNPEESRLPSDKDELRLLKTKAEMMDFEPQEHVVPGQEDVELAEIFPSTEPEPTVPAANPPGVQGSGTGTETGPVASAEAISAVVEPPPTTPALGGVTLPGQKVG